MQIGERNYLLLQNSCFILFFVGYKQSDTVFEKLCSHFIVVLGTKRRSLRKQRFDRTTDVRSKIFPHQATTSNRFTSKVGRSVTITNKLATVER